MTDPIDEAIADREHGHLDPGAAEAEQDRVERDWWRRLEAEARSAVGVAASLGLYLGPLRAVLDERRPAPGPGEVCTPGHCDRCVPGADGEHLDVHTFGQLPCEHVGGRG